MEEVKRVIACTQENAAQMRAVVKQWPQLQSLVSGLQAQGVFPGLRGLQITLVGDAGAVAQGLDGLQPAGGVQAASSMVQGAGEGVCN